MNVNHDERIFLAAKEATEEQMKKYASEFLTVAKFCHARFNLLENNQKNNPINCTQAPRFIQSNFHPFVADDILGPVNQVQSSSRPYVDDDERFKSYCPNKTVEFIENLI
ncbi:MAG: hypothetical protein H7328_13425 [Bdellovibrio sp.]|nr:hypothetical protein [Bdellovibrio sp.]